MSPITTFLSASLAFSSHELEKIHMQNHRVSIGLIQKTWEFKIGGI